ncbi:MAG TPA: NUDIX hydrolase [Herpetosiphonaceae bacterium]|nr:NUDIX hydrolase [Herpetosiphonaceae bacterium]
MESAARPRVGVSVIICRDRKVLLGQRQASHGAGSWQFPGGHLEYGEAVEECAIREVAEETGLAVAELRRGPYTNDVFAAEGKHYITLFLVADCPEGEPEAREPEKCAGWAWFGWDELPAPLFLPVQNLLALGWTPFEKAKG